MALKEYRKKTTIEAEQFSADPKQVFRYSIFLMITGTDLTIFSRQRKEI